MSSVRVVMGTSLVGAPEDQFDHEPSFPDPGVPNRLVFYRGVGCLGEKGTDRHRLVVAEHDLVSGHAYHCNNSLQPVGDGASAECFDFLGFHHHKVESWRWRSRWYLQRWPSQRAMASIRAKIRDATDRRFVGYSLETAVLRLNPVLRGWAAYFRVGNSSRKFTTIDSYVHMRLARLASNKHGLSHRNWARTSRFNLEWLNGLGIYRLTGTVRWATTHA